MHIIKVIIGHLQKVIVSAKRTEYRRGTKLHVEFKNNFWDNISQPHCDTGCCIQLLIKLKLNRDKVMAIVACGRGLNRDKAMAICACGRGKAGYSHIVFRK